jgi:hypothetical protein
MRAKMASHHARIFHGKCMAAKVSLAQAADSETKKTVIDSQVEMLVVTLEHALATREHGEAIEKNLDEVLAAVEGIGLPGDKLLTVIKLLEQIGTQYGGKKSWSMQEYSTAFQYFDQRFWDMVNNRAPLPCIEAAWFKLTLDLGCRHPSENTSRLWTAFFLAVHPGMEICSAIGPDALKAEHRRVKIAFKNFTCNATPPTDRISTLPADPKMLEIHFPETFKVAFPDVDAHPPVICPFPLAIVNQISYLWKCRGPGSNLQSALTCYRANGLAQLPGLQTAAASAALAPALQMQLAAVAHAKHGMYPVGRAVQHYEIAAGSATEPRCQGDTSAIAMANAAANYPLTRTDSEISLQSQASAIGGGARFQTQPEAESKTKYEDPMVALNMLMDRAAPNIGAEQRVLQAVNARHVPYAGLKPTAETKQALAAAFQAASGHESDQAEHNGPKQGTKKTMKRPVGPPTMKRPAAAPAGASVSKRPAAAGGPEKVHCMSRKMLDMGYVRTSTDVVNLPKLWSVWTKPPRTDKYFVDGSTGNKYRSVGEVKEALGLI